MKCIKDHILQAFLDGELSDSVRADVEKHLSSCASCAQQMESIRTRSVGLKHALRIEATTPPAFEARNTQNEPARHASLIKPILHNRWVYACSAACILAAVFLFKPSVCNGTTDQSLLIRQELEEVDANRPYEDQKTVIKLEAYPDKN